MTAPQNSLQNPTPFNVSNQNMPSEGPRCVPLGFNFSTAASFDVNLVNFQNQGKISFFQGMYVDNSGNTNPLSITFQATGQNITVKGGTQGYYPILALKTMVCTVASTMAAVNVTIEFYNVPIAPSNWAASATGGTQAVADAILDATVNANRVTTTDATTYTPLGYQQIVGLAAATALTAPGGSKYAWIIAEVQAVRWRDDGTNPSATVGEPLAVGVGFWYNGNLAAIKFFQQTATATLNISYYA